MMVLDLFKSRRRARLRAQPTPKNWRRILERNLPIFSRLSPADQAELLGHTQVFLTEKRFEGAGGLELTDEMRVTIAGQACLLLLHRETDYYPELVSIIVYPSGYTAHEDRHIGGGDTDRGRHGRALLVDACRAGATRRLRPRHRPRAGERLAVCHRLPAGGRRQPGAHRSAGKRPGGPGDRAGSVVDSIDAGNDNRRGGR